MEAMPNKAPQNAYILQPKGKEHINEKQQWQHTILSDVC